MRELQELADALAQAAADVRWAQDWRDVGDLLGALEQRARDAHEKAAAVVAERDRLRRELEALRKHVLQLAAMSGLPLLDDVASDIDDVLSGGER